MKESRDFKTNTRLTNLAGSLGVLDRMSADEFYDLPHSEQAKLIQEQMRQNVKDRQKKIIDKYKSTTDPIRARVEKLLASPYIGEKAKDKLRKKYGIEKPVPFTPPKFTGGGLDEAVKDLKRRRGLQSGAFVPGVGSGDKVRALLEPGEFVLNRNAVQAAGVGNLDRFNKKHSRFQIGGPVGMQEGGMAEMAAGPDFTFFNEIVQKFATKVDLLADSLNSINGLEIQLMANHKVEVLINGAQVLQQIEPSIQNLVVSETNKAINSMLKTKFPDVGIMD